MKALVATSVAEEGMDISACNLIIKYNVVGSERTMIQRRGRARALNSKAVLLTVDDGTESRELQNMQRERDMHSCLKDLGARSSGQLRELIATMRREVEREEEAERRVAERRRQLLRNNKYDVVCANCHLKLCDGSYMRQLYNEYVCIRPDIWTLVKIAHASTPSVSLV